MLVTSRTNAKWMLPKGWPMVGKTDAEAALQEAREEAGVDGVVSDLPVGSYVYLRQENDGSTRPAQAIIYSVRVTQQWTSWDEKGQRRRRWFKAETAAALVYERDLARFLAALAAGRVFLT
jgi:8-oxo-dGTP pyrophosphatase MutT (NUDIX family)